MNAKESLWDILIISLQIEDDVVLPADVEGLRIGGGDDDSEFANVQPGYPPSTHWANNSRLLADHVAAGAFESAARLLRDQLGIVRIRPFKSVFMHVYAR